jgi:hypothetical protein
MATAPRHRRGRAARRGGALLPLVVLAVLIVEALVAPARPAAAGGPPAAEVVPAVVAGYSGIGTLAVAVARQHVPRAGLTIRETEARSARVAASLADNGPAASRPFPAASMVKLFMAADILHRIRTGTITATRADFALLQDMIRRSDDPAASALWDRFGGDRMVTDVAARYGLTGTAPPAVPGQWGEATTTARDLARFLMLLPTVEHRYDAAALMFWMRSATPLAADGFDQRFGILGAVPGRPAVKQGWMCCVGGNVHLHSVGVVGHRVVVLLSEVPSQVGYEAARAALTAAATAIPPPQQHSARDGGRPD